MGKTLRKDNGQFNGSIGDGGKYTPTAPPTVPVPVEGDAAAAPLLTVPTPPTPQVTVEDVLAPVRDMPWAEKLEYLEALLRGRHLALSGEDKETYYRACWQVMREVPFDDLDGGEFEHAHSGFWDLAEYVLPETRDLDIVDEAVYMDNVLVQEHVALRSDLTREQVEHLLYCARPGDDIEDALLQGGSLTEEEEFNILANPSQESAWHALRSSRHPAVIVRAARMELADGKDRANTLSEVVDNPHTPHELACRAAIASGDTGHSRFADVSEEEWTLHALTLDPQDPLAGF